MKKVFLLSLMSFSLINAWSQSRKAYAITADVKGTYNWISVKEIDLSTGEVVKSVYDPTSRQQFQLKTVDGQNLSARGGQDIPTSTGVAAAAYDEKNQRLYFTNMRGNELRYFDLAAQTVTVVVNPDQQFNTGSKADESNVITRMAIGADGFGYALTNDGRNLVRFSLEGKPTITNLGAVRDDSRNGGVSIHNQCTSWGGDMIADAYGNLYVFSMRGQVFRINPNTRVAEHLGAVKGLPADFTINGTAVDAEGHVVISSAVNTGSYYRLNLGTMTALSIPKAGENVWNASDLASSNLAYRGGLNNTIVAPEVKGNDQISVYPNPVASSFINVSFEKITPGIYTIELLDASGRRVVNQVTEVTGVQSQRVNLPKSVSGGMYLVKVINADGKAVFHEKIVVQ